jgi:proteasome accessory factor B
MSDHPTKTQRWLDLIALLLGRILPLTVEEIMERVPAYAHGWGSEEEKARASARRMFERDKDELRAAGIPIETVRYRINHGAEELEGYRIPRGDFYLPYLRLLSESAGSPRTSLPREPYAGVPRVELTHSEADLALDALHRVADVPAFPFADDARSALRKLSFDVDPDRFQSDSVLWVERPGTREVLERLRVLSDALLGRKRVRFAYHGIYRGETTERDVAPYGVFFQQDWYLVGHDATRDSLRVFRVGRMENLQPNRKSPKQPDFKIPTDFQLRDHLDRSAWELGDDDPMEAEVLFRFPLSVWAARNEEGELVSNATDGSAIRRFRVSQPNPFLRWILSLGGEAEILSPSELRAGLEDMAHQVAALSGLARAPRTGARPGCRGARTAGDAGAGAGSGGAGPEPRPDSPSHERPGCRRLISAAGAGVAVVVRGGAYDRDVPGLTSIRSMFPC